MRNNIHKTAIVDESLVIGNNVVIGPYTVIHPNVKIGNNTIIESHCVLNSNTEIGNNNRIYDHVIIGSDPQDLSFDTSRKTFVQIRNLLLQNFLPQYLYKHLLEITIVLDVHYPY